MEYQYLPVSKASFIQQLAVSYLPNGYWFYVPGMIPPEKNVERVDKKLIDKYGIEQSKWTRARRKRAGFANVQYLRWDRFFVLLATHGRHRFFVDERLVLLDVRETPLKFAGYSIGFRNGHASVRIERNTFRDLKDYFSERALRATANDLECEFSSLECERYAPVRSQICIIFRLVNRLRKQAGLEQLEPNCLLKKRKSQPVFTKKRAA